MVASSGLAVMVPEAVPVVRPWRRLLDPGAELGVPAHVTVLFPFVPPSEIDDGVCVELQRLFAEVEPFDFALVRTGWFDDTVLYLAPEPDRCFHELTERVTDRWPEHPPYGGAYSEVVPHLTVGQGAPLDELRRAERDVAAKLPVRSRAESVHLLTGSGEPGSWSVACAFLLGG